MSFVIGQNWRLSPRSWNILVEASHIYKCLKTVETNHPPYKHLDKDKNKQKYSKKKRHHEQNNKIEQLPQIHQTFDSLLSPVKPC